MKFNEWLDVFIKEKVIDLDESFILDCEYYHTNIYYRTVINTIKRLSKDDKKELKKLLVKLDFLNGDVKKFLRDFSEAYIIKEKRLEKRNTLKPKKCAIYNRITYGTKEQLEERRKELISYCEETLGIYDYVIFEEIAPDNDSRKEFNNMLDRIHQKEFTDLLTTEFSRYYRWDNEKLGKLMLDINDYGVDIHFKHIKSILYIRKLPASDKRIEYQMKKTREMYAKKGYNVLMNFEGQGKDFLSLGSWLGFDSKTYAWLEAESRT